MTFNIITVGAGYMFSPTVIFRELALFILKVFACFFLFNMIISYMTHEVPLSVENFSADCAGERNFKRFCMFFIYMGL